MTVTTLLSSIWSDLLLYLSTVTVNKDAPGSETSLHKSRASQVSRQTCYNKICKQGVVKINKVCHSAKRESVEEGIAVLIAELGRLNKKLAQQVSPEYIDFSNVDSLYMKFF